MLMKMMMMMMMKTSLFSVFLAILSIVAVVQIEAVVLEETPAAASPAVDADALAAVASAFVCHLPLFEQTSTTKSDPN